MPLGKCNHPSISISWATTMIALFMLFIVAGCKLKPESFTPTDIQLGTTNQNFPATVTHTVTTGIFKPRPSQTQPAAHNSQSPVSNIFPTQTEEATSMPFVPIVGGADKIAFIQEDDIWMANLDGNQLTQLTDDKLPKSSLQWSADKRGIFYIADLCIYLVDTQTLRTSTLTCLDQAQRLESFNLSPDNKQAAISLDGQLYVVPFVEDELSQARSGQDLNAMADCKFLAPYKHRTSIVTVSKARWSADNKQLAILRQAYDQEHQVELIQLIDITNCSVPFPRVDEFPATRFEMEGYDQTPIIQDFAWDGGDLFAMTSFKRNDGFGDLWIYNTNLHRGFLANPIDGKCCYRDPVFSPDGKYLAFVFQDASYAANSPAVLYYIPYAALERGLVYPPIPLPTDFFSEPRTKPQPIFRSAR
ncbi:MAG: hypothetical protein ACWGN2_10255 [Anaerolineales bacterium]